jgi:hypothetical protein
MTTKETEAAIRTVFGLVGLICGIAAAYHFFDGYGVLALAYVQLAFKD